MLSVESAGYIDGYRLELTFNDGKTGVVDLYRVVHEDQRSVFSELGDLEKFKDFQVDFNTVCWSNGLDLASEFLYFLAFHDDPTLQDQFEEWGYSRRETLSTAKKG